MDNITTVNNEKLIERRFDTRLNRKINNNVVLALDNIAKDYITSLNNPTLWDINVAIYTAKQYNNNLKEIPAEKTKPRQQPGWITQLEHRINSIRSIRNCHIKCENKGSFTRHQKQLQKKFRKMFHTRKIKTFESHLIFLKQDLKAKTKKLRYKNKLLQRKRIKNQFNRNTNINLLASTYKILPN